MYKEGYSPRLARFIQHCIKRSAENNKTAATRHAVCLCGLCINGTGTKTQAWPAAWLWARLWTGFLAENSEWNSGGVEDG